MVQTQTAAQATGDGTTQNANADTSGESEYSSDSMFSHIPPKNSQGVNAGGVNGGTTNTLTPEEQGQAFINNFDNYGDRAQEEFEQLSDEAKAYVRKCNLEV